MPRAWQMAIRFRRWDQEIIQPKMVMGAPTYFLGRNRPLAKSETGSPPFPAKGTSPFFGSTARRKLP